MHFLWVNNLLDCNSTFGGEWTVCFCCKKKQQRNAFLKIFVLTATKSLLIILALWLRNSFLYLSRAHVTLHLIFKYFYKTILKYDDKIWQKHLQQIVFNICIPKPIKTLHKCSVLPIIEVTTLPAKYFSMKHFLSWRNFFHLLCKITMY